MVKYEKVTHTPPESWEPEKPILIPFVDFWARIHDARLGKWCVQIVPAYTGSEPASDDPRWGVIDSDLFPFLDSLHEARLWLCGFLLCAEIIEGAWLEEQAEQAVLLEKLDKVLEELKGS